MQFHIEMLFTESDLTMLTHKWQEVQQFAVFHWAVFTSLRKFHCDATNQNYNRLYCVFWQLGKLKAISSCAVVLENADDCRWESLMPDYSTSAPTPSTSYENRRCHFQDQAAQLLASRCHQWADVPCANPRRSHLSTCRLHIPDCPSRKRQSTHLGLRKHCCTYNISQEINEFYVVWISHI